ncbi:MAG: hypothetical protein R6X02_33090 [Enhygromyxa sp.]
MPRPITSVMLVGALCCASACESQTTPKQEPPKPAPSEAKPTRAEPPQPAAETQARSPEADEHPPWFDAAKIPHAAVLQQMASQGAIAGGQAWAMLLELEPGVSNAQCIDHAKAAIGEGVAELPEAVASDDGRLTLQGEAEGYHFTIVCGEAKGKPTMYLSYTR